MGLFDSLSGLVNKVQSLAGSELAAPILDELKQNGLSMDDLIAKLKQSGFGEQVASWLGDGPKLPIDADSVQQVLGSDVVQNIAGKIGVDPQQVSSTVAKFLPDVVSHLGQSGQDSAS